jgi:thiol:disulfide interchange protein DsbD
LAVGLPAAQALGIFAALGLGMALPYVLLSWAPGLLRWLPRPGPWMATFRRAMAFPMLATVVWLAWVLGQQTGADGIAALLALLLTLSALIWALTLRGLARWWLGAALLAFLAWMAPSMWPYLQAAPVASATANNAVVGDLWQPWSPEAQAQLLAQGRPVFVDYTAAWCVTCQFNKRTTLSNPQVLQAFSRHEVQLLRADWTRQDPRITQSLNALGRSGVPVYVLLAPGQAPVVLTELISTDEVLQALENI